MTCFVYCPRVLLTLLIVCLTLGLGSNRLSAQIITTVAGNGTPDYSGDGSVATSASLSFPYSIAVDAGGNLFITDANNHCIRKVTPAGIITTVAGTGRRGFSGDGGPATAAQLTSPSSVLVDGQGNLLIADSGNNRIRKVTPGGIITTIVGTGLYDFSGDGGPALKASLRYPQDIALDGSGNLFIADKSNNRVRKVALNGTISTVAGNGNYEFSGDGGLAIQAGLNGPVAVALDGWGNLFITDHYNLRIRRVSPAGDIRTVAGNGEFGYNGDGITATRAQIGYCGGITVDVTGNLFIADGLQRIRKVTPTGIITTVAGGASGGYGGDGGSATGARLNSPEDVTLDAAGNLFIADAVNNRIRKVTAIAPAVRVQSFMLINADNQHELKTITSGETINLASLPTRNLNIMALGSPDVVGSVKLVLSGRQNRTQLETGSPYALFGEKNGRFNAWTPALGQYTLTATAYTAAGGVGSASAPLSVSFTVIDQPSAGPAVVSFSLMNADTDQPIRVITNNEVLNLAQLPRNLNIRANTNPATVGSVKMVLSGPQKRTQTETGAPYALFGDKDGDYNNWTPTVGNYTLTGTAYSGANASGQAGTPLSISFRVVNQGANARLSAEAGLDVVLLGNPMTGDEVVFEVRGAGEHPVRIQLLDAKGLLITERQLEHVGSQVQRLSVAGQPAGLLLLRVSTPQQSRTLKVIKRN